MARVWISLGSNCNDAAGKIRNACSRLRSVLNEFSMSELYVTSAVGKPAPDYTNCVVTGLTAASAAEVETLCKSIEKSLGRTHSDAGNIVEIDLDLVVYNNQTLRPADFNRQYFLKGYKQLIISQQ